MGICSFFFFSSWAHAFPYLLRRQQIRVDGIEEARVGGLFLVAGLVLGSL